jgi:hypothetical protein
MYISVWRTVCLMVMLANLELDIFLNHKTVTIDYRHTFSFIYAASVSEKEAVTNFWARLSCVCFCLSQLDYLPCVEITPFRPSPSTSAGGSLSYYVSKHSVRLHLPEKGGVKKKGVVN